MHFRYRQMDRRTDTDIVYMYMLHLDIKIVYTITKLHVSVHVKFVNAAARRN